MGGVEELESGGVVSGGVESGGVESGVMSDARSGIGNVTKCRRSRGFTGERSNELSGGCEARGGCAA